MTVSPSGPADPRPWYAQWPHRCDIRGCQAGAVFRFWTNDGREIVELCRRHAVAVKGIPEELKSA